jgi:serine/threonine protein kinase
LNTLGDSAQTAFLPGETIAGTFLVNKQIGSGGMGVVYLVKHTALNKLFALKALAPDLVNEQNWLRFKAEAKTMASLNHRTFVNVYDLGIHAKTVPFYSMDYLSGRTLETLLVEDGPIELRQAIEIFLEVLDGLAYAHSHGIIHRDIKPANIMICTTGSAATGSTAEVKERTKSVKILDFGISKFVGSDGKKAQNLTTAGDIFGSPYYMSPEQCTGEAVDGRSDIYSIGCSLFEALSGVVPYEANNSIEIALLHQEQEPPKLAEIRPELDLPPSIDQVIARCLAKEPAERYQSAKELSADLIRVKEGQDVEAYNLSYPETTSRKPSQKKVAIISAVVTAPLIVAAAATLITSNLTTNKGPSYPKQAINSIGNLNSSEAPDLLKQAEAKKQETNNKLMKMLERSAFSNESTGHTIAEIELVEQITNKESGLPIAKTVLIKEFIRQRTEPYSTLRTVDGVKVNRFNFPTNFSLGTIGFTKPGTNKWTMVPAQGTIAVGYGRPVSLTAGQALLSYPELLNYFRPNEIDTVNLNDSQKLPLKLLQALAKQTQLHRLELRATMLSNKDITLLEKFQALKSLDIGNTNITSAALAKCKILPQLQTLHVNMLSDVTPVLTVLVKSNNLTDLYLNNVKLSNEDYALISRTTKLQILSLKESATKDADLLKLSSLPNLTTLYIDRCGNLTPATIDTLKRFKSLKELRPPDQIEELFSDEALQQSLPHLRLI